MAIKIYTHIKYNQTILIYNILPVYHLAQTRPCFPRQQIAPVDAFLRHALLLKKNKSTLCIFPTYRIFI